MVYTSELVKIVDKIDEQFNDFKNFKFKELPVSFNLLFIFCQFYLLINLLKFEFKLIKYTEQLNLNNTKRLELKDQHLVCSYKLFCLQQVIYNKYPKLKSIYNILNKLFIKEPPLFKVFEQYYDDIKLTYKLTYKVKEYFEKIDKYTKDSKIINDFLNGHEFVIQSEGNQGRNYNTSISITGSYSTTD